MKACFKSVVIPGEKGMNMGGYEGREHGNVGIHDDVFEKNCLIEQEDNYVAFVSGDFIVVNIKMLHNVKERVS